MNVLETTIFEGIRGILGFHMMEYLFVESASCGEVHIYISISHARKREVGMHRLEKSRQVSVPHMSVSCDPLSLSLTKKDRALSVFLPSPLTELHRAWGASVQRHHAVWVLGLHSIVAVRAPLGASGE